MEKYLQKSSEFQVAANFFVKNNERWNYTLTVLKKKIEFKNIAVFKRFHDFEFKQSNQPFIMFDIKLLLKYTKSYKMEIKMN